MQYRTLTPFVRGCGGTRFLRDDTPRAGDFAALGQDALDFVDMLGLDGLAVVGQEGQEIGGDLSPHLDALLNELREEARSEARVLITNALQQGYRRMALPEPTWLYRT